MLWNSLRWATVIQSVNQFLVFNPERQSRVVFRKSCEIIWSATGAAPGTEIVLFPSDFPLYHRSCFADWLPPGGSLLHRLRTRQAHLSRRPRHATPIQNVERTYSQLGSVVPISERRPSLSAQNFWARRYHDCELDLA